MKPFDQDLVSGSITHSVWKLAWPVVLLNLVNGLHGFVDHVLVGHYIGYEANAGIGVAWQVFIVIIVFFTSLYHGMNVLVARYTGKQDRRTLSVVAYQAFLSSVLILSVLGVIGYIFTPQLLRLVKASPVVISQALPYMRILFVGGMPIMLMFMLTGAMQASGDPRTPLLLGILATSLNIVLSIILITGAGPAPRLGVVGAALATCIAPLISVLVAIVLILRGHAVIQAPERFTLVPDLSIMRVVARIGIPTGLQGVLLNIGGVFLLRYFGSLEHSAAAQAAYTICYAQLFALAAWPARGLRNASSALNGAEPGCRRSPARARKAVHVAFLFGDDVGMWHCLPLSSLSRRPFWDCSRQRMSPFEGLAYFSCGTSPSRASF